MERNNISADKQIQYEHILNIVDNIVSENGDIFDGHTDIGNLSDEKILLFDMKISQAPLNQFRKHKSIWLYQ